METFEQLLYQLHLSYLQARKNKRNTHNQLAFELNQEENLHQLAKAIFERKYTPKPCEEGLILYDGPQSFKGSDGVEVMNWKDYLIQN